MNNPMTDKRALELLRANVDEDLCNYIAVRLAQPAVPALDVFRIAGGDVECCPEPTAQEALDCLRNLRECYDEVLRQPAEAVAWQTRHTLADGSWYGWSSALSESEAIVSCERVRQHGYKAEHRCLFTRPQPPAIPEPTAAHWRRAIRDISHAPYESDDEKESLDAIEQRARELAREESHDQ